MTQKKKFPPTPERSWDDAEGTKRVWALMAHSERDNNGYDIGGGYRHLRFDLVSVADVYDPDKRLIRNDLRDGTRDLEINSQGNRLDPDKLYAYRPEFRGIHSADIERLTAMYEFLSTLHKKLDQETRTHGSAPDYAHYVVRIARLLGCHYIIEKRADSAHWSSYDEGDYRYTSLRTDGKFNGQECLWKVQQLVRDLWSESDRKDAAIQQERRAAEDRARKAAEHEGDQHGSDA